VRFFFAISLLGTALSVTAFAQDAAPPDPAPAPAPDTPAPPPGPPVVTVSAAPLSPPDLDSPYASARDAARHRLHATLAALTVNRDLRDGIRGFAQAFLEDPTYAAAAYDLAILAAIEEKWDDAAAALDQAARLDPRGLGAAAAPQLERLKLIASTEKSADGRRKRRFDEALLRLLDQLPVLSLDAAISTLGELGRIDPKRWEAPAMLAGLNGDGRGYETAAKFLEIAVANAAEPAVRAALETARRATERELQYSSTRAAAEAASDSGDYAKAADLYQSAWTAIPARVENGLDAASALLLSDDTTHASALLARLRDSGDAGASSLTQAMLKQLEPIEPTAKSPTSDAPQFFRDRGPREPVQIATLIPQVDRKTLEIYARPLPKLVDDPEPVVLLASLAADSPVKDAPLPTLTSPSIPGETPWLEIASIKTRTVAANASSARPAQAVDLAGNAAPANVLQVTSQPAGARLFLSGQGQTSSAEPVCETPCNLRLAGGEYSIRMALLGYQDSEQTVQLTSEIQELTVPLTLLRGSVIVETPAPVELRVNGTPAGTQSPAELSLAPGVYRIGANFGSKIEERLLNVKPGARLRLDFRP
jgi:hypothetical protein